MAYNSSNSGSLSKDEEQKLVEKIRKRFDYMVLRHKNNRDRGALCMRALSPLGPWDPLERQRRKDLKIACIHLDQLNQYCNVLINEFRESPVGIEIIPEGGGADDDTATLRGDRLRNLEEKCNAIKRAYLPALEGSVQRGYGAFGVITKEISPEDDNQTIEWRGFPNPDAVLWDPDIKEIDGSDMEYCFVLDRMSKEAAIEKYGEAAGEGSFGDEYISLAPAWANSDDVQIAEYWYKKYRKRTVYQVYSEDRTQIVKKFKDELKDVEEVEQDGVTWLMLPDGTQFEVVNSESGKPLKKEAQVATICQCMTNGVRVWDHLEWGKGKRRQASWIPIVPMLGKVKFTREVKVSDGAITESANVEMVTESYILNAIDAAMLYDFYKTAEVIIVSMTPKTPVDAIKGQLDGHEAEWIKSFNEPVPFRLYNAVTDDTGTTILPPPTRQPYEPQIAPLEVGAESARRAIQSALGSYGFTKMDDTNVKSGIAIERLNKQSESGAYHFIDNAKISIQHGGRIANELLDIIEDNKREVGITKEDGTRNVVKLNEPYKDEQGKDQNYQYNRSDNDRHGVIASVRNAGQSQHEEQNEFLLNLVQSQNPMVQLAALREAIRYQNLGPLEAPLLESIEAVIKMQAPALAKDQGEMPPEAAAEIQKAQQIIEELKTALQEAKFKEEAKTVEKQGDMAIAQAKSQSDIQKAQVESELKAAQVQQQLQLEAFKAEQENQRLAFEQKMKQNELEAKDSLERFKAELDAATKLAIADKNAATQTQAAELSAKSASETADKNLENTRIVKGPATHPKLDEVFEQVQQMLPVVAELKSRKPRKGVKVIRNAKDQIDSVEDVY